MDRGNGVARITQRQLEKFMWENIVCRYGVPNTLIMDNGTQLTRDHMKDFWEGLHIHMPPSSVAHPQTNGQTEAINGVILAAMKKRLNEAKGAWPNELPWLIWSMRTTPNLGMRDTPFSVAFGHEAVIPTKIDTKTLRVAKYSKKANEQLLREELDLIQERRALASIHAAVRKQQGQLLQQTSQATKLPSRRSCSKKLHRQQTMGTKKLSSTCEGPYKITEFIGKGPTGWPSLMGLQSRMPGMPCTSKNIINDVYVITDWNQ